MSEGVVVAGGRWRHLWPLSVVALVVVLDAVSKELAQLWLGGGEVVSAIPWLLDLRLIYNRGVSFGFLSTAPGWAMGLIVVLGAVLTVFGVWQAYKCDRGRLVALGWALFAGGAAGNLWERAYRGQVTDFLSLRLGDLPLFVFNLADFALTAAIALLVWGDWLRGRSAGGDAAGSGGGQA